MNLSIDKLTVPLINKGVDRALEDFSRRIPIIRQSLAGFRCITTTVKSLAKCSTSSSTCKKFMYGTAAFCSGSASICFLGSSAFSILVPNVSIPLMATGEALLYSGTIIDGTTDGITFLP
jgi:hypothetical protein